MKGSGWWCTDIGIVLASSPGTNGHLLKCIAVMVQLLKHWVPHNMLHANIMQLEVPCVFVWMQDASGRFTHPCTAHKNICVFPHRSLECTSVCLCVCPSVCVMVRPPVCTSVRHRVRLCASVSIHACILGPGCVPVYPSMCPKVSTLV